MTEYAAAMVSLSRALLTAGLEPESVMSAAAQAITQSFQRDSAVRLLLPGGDTFTTSAYSYEGGRAPAPRSGWGEGDRVQGASAEALRSRHPWRAADGAASSLACVMPLIAQGEALGTLEIQGTTAGSPLPGNDTLVEAASLVALALWNALRHQELRVDRRRLEEAVTRQPIATLVGPPGVATTPAPQARLAPSDGALLRTFLDSAPVVSYLKNRDGVYLFVNTKYARDIGLTSPEEVVGKTDHQVHDQRLADFFRGVDLRVIESGKVMITEDTFFLNGAWHAFLTVKFPLLDATSFVTGVGGFTIEITDRKRSEAAVARAQEQVDFVIDALPALVLQLDIQGRVQAANRACELWFGTPRTRLIGRDWREVVGAAVDPAVLKQLTRAVDGERCTFEARLAHSAGGDRDVEITYTPQRGLTGQVECVIALVTDVTERNEAAERAALLAEASRILSSSLDARATVHAVAALAVPRLADCCVVELSDADGARALLAVSHVEPSKVEAVRQAFLGTPTGGPGLLGLAGLRGGDAPVVIERLDEPAGAEGAGAAQDERLRALGLRSALVVPILAGPRVAGAMTFASGRGRRALRDADETYATALARRVSLAVENARLYAEAQAAIRLRDDFLSVAGHELKTPLTAMLLDLETLRLMIERGQGSQPDALRGRLGKARAAAKRLENFIHGLLDISRVRRGSVILQPEPLDFAEVVRTTAGGFASSAGHAGCELQMDVPESALPGAWDRLRLEQVVSNLVENALKYGAGKPVDVAVRGTEEQVRLTVRDQGIGIAPADQERIFAAFERAVSDRHYGGLGLGLWITREIVTSMGGSIRVESRPGEGALFLVELPRQPAS